MTKTFNSQTENVRGKKIFRNIICVLLCFLSLFPFFILLINSTLDSDTIKKGLHLLPGSNFSKNLQGLLAKSTGLTLGRAIRNSLIVTVPVTLLQVYFATFTAYGVTVYNFKFKKLAWGFIYAIMMIPTQVSVVGLIKVCNITHMFGTFFPLILPAIAAPTTVYFMKQYMQNGLSLEIVEASRIDGSGEFKTFNKIVLPLMFPAMATQAIFAFVSSWNNLYVPSLLLVTRKDTLGTMPMFVAALESNDYKRDMGQIYMGLFISVLPIMVAYFILSKYIVAGVALGGVKE